MAHLTITNIGGIFSVWFIQEKYFWRLLCAFCSGVLTIHLLTEWIVVKPTGSSYQQVPLSVLDIPDILVCRREGFHHGKLREYGYQKTSKYNDGVASNGMFVGWSGLHNLDPIRILWFLYSYNSNATIGVILKEKDLQMADGV